MMNQQLPPGLAMGIAAAQLEQQGQYKPFTSDGTPTVMNQKLSELSQKEAAKQAQTAAQIEAMKQAQMQQMLQQMLAQKSQAAPMASGGIASLPGSDVEMAEGGVVGYAGPDGSEVEVDESKLPLKERIARTLARIRSRSTPTEQQLAPSEPSAPEPPAKIPEGSDRRLDIPEGGIVSPGTPTPMFDPEAIALMQRQSMTRAPVPSPRPSAGERKQPAAPLAAAPAAPMLPDTREPTTVNPSQSELKYATEVGRLKELQERLGKKPEESAQEKAYRDATMAEYQRGLGSIDSARERFNAAQLEQKNKDIINYLSGIGGATSLFRGMSRSGQALSQVQDQREAAKVAYFDKLDERRNAVENLKLASLRQDAEQARAWSQEVRKIDADITRLMVGLGEKQAGEFAAAEREREKTAATARENELNRKAQKELEEYRRQTQLMKPHEIQLIDKLAGYKLDELTGGKPNTATPAQQAQALREAIQEARGGARTTDFSRQYDIALSARLAKGEPDNPETREAARQDVIRGTPAAQRADTARIKEAQAMVERLMLTQEYRKIKDKAEARRLAKAEAAREYKLTPTDIPDSGAAQPTTTAPRGTRDNPIKLD